jgi:dolichyl-phosphate-mannose-protein mannosyltransferase
MELTKRIRALSRSMDSSSDEELPMVSPSLKNSSKLKNSYGNDYNNDKYSKSFDKYSTPQNYWVDEVFDSIDRYDRSTLFITAILTFMSLFSRLYNIHVGAFVIWDEAHFGKFASNYIRRQFYFDVHPPIGKMLVALSGVLAAYGGGFEFKSGEDYPSDLHYAVMRSFLAVFGAMVVPLAFLTAKELGFSLKASILVASFAFFDNAYLTISRYILLDSMLLYFTAQTFYGLSVFRSVSGKPFSPGWWFWLIFTGVSIGLVSSVKWVGLFVTALVGCYTIYDLWNLLGDQKISMVTFFI